MAGCLHLDRSPRSAYQIWAKPGQSFESIKAELDSCGYRDPTYSNYTTRVKPLTHEEYARTETCMYKKGYNANFGIRSICESFQPQYHPVACTERDFPTPKPNP